MTTAVKAVPVELYGANNNGDQRRFACANATAITKGSLLYLSGDRTASWALTTGAVFAGIASMDKEASDGSTSISCWENGIFEIECSGAVGLGQKVKIATNPSGSDFIMAATTTDCESSYAQIVGVALEAGLDLEVINVRVNN